MIDRVILLILDSLGVGALPDAALYGDEGSDTLRSVLRESGADIPNLCRLGLGNLTEAGCTVDQDEGCWGRMRELSPGKDTTTGHWEMTGLVLDYSFPTYPEGFPRRIMEEFERIIGTRTIGNIPASGTDILNSMGEEHLRTGHPIVYTSADSVFQIAAHREITPIEQLYDYCRAARKILDRESNPVARVIARPFTGSGGRYRRDNASRMDFSIEPPGNTLLDNLKDEGKMVFGIGKTGDIFAHRGFTDEVKTADNTDTCGKLLDSIKANRGRRGLIMANFVDFDSAYGHRRDALGYGKSLEEFDRFIPLIKCEMSESDILIITADHGCDPTHSRHSDHTREYVPLLAWGQRTKKKKPLGMDLELSDCGQTVADLLGSGKLLHGKSLKNSILRR